MGLQHLNTDLNSNVIISPNPEQAEKCKKLYGINFEPLVNADTQSVGKSISTEVDIIGVQWYTRNAEFGDYATLEIIDIDNILGQGEDFKAGDFGEEIQIFPESPLDMVDQFVCKTLPSGLYLQVKYHAVDSGSTRQMQVNFVVRV